MIVFRGSPQDLTCCLGVDAGSLFDANPHIVQLLQRIGGGFEGKTGKSTIPRWNARRKESERNVVVFLNLQDIALKSARRPGHRYLVQKGECGMF